MDLSPRAASPPDPRRWKALALLCSAFAAAIIFPAVGLLVALLLLGKVRAPVPMTAEPAAAAAE
jgi:hypothetical protein